MPKPKLPTEKFKSKKVEIRFTEKQHLHLKRLAKANDCTVSDYIRSCIDFFTRMKHDERI